MSKFSIKIRIPYLIIPLLLAFLLYVFSLLFFFLPSMEQSIISKKKEMIKELTTTVCDILNYYNTQVMDSVLTLEQAQRIAVDNIKQIRYGKQKKDYFWINDFRPYMVMHPYLTELDSTDLSSYIDPDSNFLFNQMVEIALRKNEGFLSYKWQLKDDTSKVLPKISYVKAFEPWDWIVGTGVYINDINEELALLKRKLLVVSLFITLLALILYLYVIRRGLGKEKLLKEVEIKYKKIFEEANDGILLLRDDKFIDCNSKALKLFNCTRNEIIGKSVIDFSVEYQEDGSESMSKALKIISECNKGKSQFFEWTHKTAKDKPFIAEVSLTNVELNDRTFLISFIRDITKRKNSEKKLIQAMERAEASDKLKSAFLANMSHEIRTPMNGILGFSQLLQEDNLNLEKRSEYLRIIMNKGKQLMQIINDIIDISKIESNQISANYSEFSLNQLIDDLYAFFSVEYRDVEFNVMKELSEKQDIIRSDYTRLTQILNNLLSNAFKFTEKGFVELGYQIKDNQIYFYVKDSGIGVKAKDQQIIFDRFRQSDDSTTRMYGGTGLGLSISKGLVDLLGGKIGVESDGKTGSLFYFTIPLVLVQSIQESSKPKEKKNEWADKEILIVEDDDASFMYLKELLAETKANIQHVKTGDDAIKLVHKNKIDLILMDIQLPGIDGNDVTREIRTFNKSVPIIAQTANAMSDDRDKSINAGCNDYISKPINSEFLLDMVNKYLK